MISLRSRRRLGVVAWAVGVTVALVWSALSPTPQGWRGVGYAPPVTVAAYEPGRLAALHVGLHQAVAPGELLAQLDDTRLRAEREVAAAALLAAQDAAVLDVTSELRRFYDDAERTAMDRALVRVRLVEDRALAEALAVRVGIVDELSLAGAAANNERLFAAQDLAVVQARIQATEAQLALMTRSVQAREQRITQLDSVQDWQVVVAARAMELAELRVADLMLRAPIGGQVTAVSRQPGEQVAAGEPVLTVRPFETDAVISWVSAAAASSVGYGHRVRVRRASGQTLAGEVLSVGVSPEPMPVHLWLDAQRVEHGVPVRVRLLSGVVSPDEPLDVSI